MLKYSWGASGVWSLALFAGGLAISSLDLWLASCGSFSAFFPKEIGGRRASLALIGGFLTWSLGTFVRLDLALLRRALLRGIVCTYYPDVGKLMV